MAMDARAQDTITPAADDGDVRELRERVRALEEVVQQLRGNLQAARSLPPTSQAPAAGGPSPATDPGGGVLRRGAFGAGALFALLALFGRKGARATEAPALSIESGKVDIPGALNVGGTLTTNKLVASAADASWTLSRGYLDFGQQARTAIRLYGEGYSIGVQDWTVVMRTSGPSGGFAWFFDGQWASTKFDPGLGGKLAMSLDQTALNVKVPVRTSDTVSIDAAGLKIANSVSLDAAGLKIGDLTSLTASELKIGDYYPLLANGKLRIIAGMVNADGSNRAGTKVGNFTVKAEGNGLYQIDFTGPFSGAPVCSVTQMIESDATYTTDNAILIKSSSGAIRVKTGQMSGYGTDRDFSFIAIGLV